MNNKAQFTPGPTCTCEIVMRTGETLDSSLGDRPCSDISRIVLCPLHTAAPAMYEALQSILAEVTNDTDGLDTAELYEIIYFIRGKAKSALAQAEGVDHE